jgi:hypothetical protein
MRFVRMYRKAVILACASLALTAAGATGAAASVHPDHGPVIPPDPWTASAGVGNNQLSSVFCTSADNCWSVGFTVTKLGDLNQVLHWTGKKWFKVAVPNPGGTGSGGISQLAAVRCTLAANCWAVGFYEKGTTGVAFDQALHWNGTKWRLISTPTPAGLLPGSLNQLSDVSCTSAGNCWAGGFYGNDVEVGNKESELALNQLLHWNGKSWSLVAAPNPAGTKPDHASVVNSVRCASAANCWAAGAFGSIGKKLEASDEMLHWNGKKWARVTVPDPQGTADGELNELQALSCSSVSNCWAAGFYGNLNAGPTKPSALNLILHWNGKKWAKVTVPEPGAVGARNDSINGITCSADRDCWAVGQAGHSTSGKPVTDTALHWNGTKWSLVTTPNPAGDGMNDSNRLISVRCVAAGNCWAVGVAIRGGSSDNQILHWNGKKWFKD